MRGVLLMLIITIIAVIAAFYSPWLKTPLIIALCFGMASLGLSVIMRAGQISFGHAMYICISAYIVAFINQSYPDVDGIWLILIATLMTTICGAVIGLFVAKYREIFFGMLNLSISMILFALIGKFYAITGGSDGMRVDRPTIFSMMLERDQFESLLLVLLSFLAVGLVWLIERYFNSPAGKTLAAIKTNEIRLEYIGISAKYVFWKGYVISTALCGLSGSIFALIQGLVTPEIGYWLKSGELVFISILGGIGHAVGVFIGALVYEFLKLYASVTMADYWHITLGIVLILIIFFSPNGLAGWLRKKKII